MPGALDCGCLGSQGAPWHVARFVAGQERIARAAIHRLGFSTFLPLLRQAVPDKRWGRRVVTVPAFPGCVFVQWPDGAEWQRIHRQPGLLSGVSALMHAVGDPFGHPAPVPAGFMAELFERATDGGVIRDDAAPPPKARKRRWTRLGDLAGPERLDLLQQALGVQRRPRETA